MDSRVLVPIGVCCLAATYVLSSLFGVRPLATPLEAFATPSGIAVLSLAGSGAALVAAGLGVDLGPVSWRALAAAGYALLTVPLLLGVGFLGGGTAALASVGVAVLLLAAMAVDVALDARIVVAFERAGDEAGATRKG